MFQWMPAKPKNLKFHANTFQVQKNNSFPWLQKILSTVTGVEDFSCRDFLLLLLCQRIELEHNYNRKGRIAVAFSGWTQYSVLFQFCATFCAKSTGLCSSGLKRCGSLKTVCQITGLRSFLTPSTAVCFDRRNDSIHDFPPSILSLNLPGNSAFLRSLPRLHRVLRRRLRL